MREAFNRQLTELRQELVYIYANIDLQLHEALDALEEGNREKAKAVKAETRRLDDRCAALEQKAFMLIATQQPVASDLRLIQFVIYANFNLARMSNHVRNIAKTAKRCAGRDVPAQLIDLLVGEGHLVYGVLSNCVMAIVNEDLRLASSLPVLDEPVDDLYKQFFRRLSTLGPDDDKDAASRVIMASRMLERISDNAVEVGEKLVFLLTGKRRNLDDLQDLDDDDLAEMYAARSAGLVADKQVDEELAGQIPELKNDGAVPAAKGMPVDAPAASAAAVAEAANAGEAPVAKSEGERDGQ